MKSRLKRFIPAIPVSAVLLSLIFSHSCANTTQAPTGGDKDTIPPVIVKLYPAPMSTGVPVKGMTFEFTFNEYVKIKTPANIVLSPPQAKPPKSRVRGKSVLVSFEEPLDSNTTYTLSFPDAIVDNNEGNVFPGYTYVFSTGDSIDSLMLTGVVRDCNSLKPLKGMTVMLYKDLADSAVLTSRPYAVTKTDDWGFFCIRNIGDTDFRLYAVKDDNGNNIYNPDENELIGFVDTLIRPKTAVNDSLPELQHFDMKDTVNCQSRKAEYDIRLFREKPSRQFIVNKVRVSDRTSYITFNAPNAHIDSMWMRGVPASKLITQFNIQRDSLEIWVNERRRQPDTLHLFVNYRKTDTAGVLVPFVEHVKLFYEADNNAQGGKTASKSSRKDLQPQDTVCAITLTATPERIEQYGYELEFTYPVINEGFSSLKVISVNPKQQESEVAYKVIKDSLNIRKFAVMPDIKLMTGYEYILKVPHRSFRDINGFYNDSTDVKVKLPTDEHLSTLSLILEDVRNMYIVELLDEKMVSVLRSFVVDSDRTLVFPYLKAGKYCIRITEDANRNSIVDSGSLLEHRQPEKVLFYKTKEDNTIEILESTEMEQTVNMYELFNK